MEGARKLKTVLLLYEEHKVLNKIKNECSAVSGVMEDVNAISGIRSAFRNVFEKYDKFCVINTIVLYVCVLLCFSVFVSQCLYFKCLYLLITLNFYKCYLL